MGVDAALEAIGEVLREGEADGVDSDNVDVIGGAEGVLLTL